MEQVLHPAIAALDFAKAGAILANMVDSYLAAGAPPFDPEGPDDDAIEDRRATPVARRLHLHSSIDDGTSALQPGEHGAAIQSEEQGPSISVGAKNAFGSSTAISASPVRG
jgi:hypothetical protein